MKVCGPLAVLLFTVAIDAAWGSVASDCDSKGCSHECETLGEFPLCVCPPGMTLERDGITCKESVSFILAMFRGIKLYNEESEEEAIIAPVKASCLDYHYGRRELYAYTNYTIMRYPLTKGKTASPVSLVTNTESAVTSLAVDWVHDTIYYISEQQTVLGVTSLEGGDQRTILTHNESSTGGWRNLVVDPYDKKLFWIGKNGVYSSSLDGKDLATDIINWIKPDEIALDTNTQSLLVIGRKGNNRNKYIAKASYNGNKQGEDVEVTEPAASELFGFGVVRNTVYWESNRDGESLYKCGLGQVGNSRKIAATLVAELNQIVFDMKVYHGGVQKSQR